MSDSNPHGLHTVTPYLVVDDARAVIEFAQTIIGAELGRGEPRVRDDGSVMHAELTVGDSVIMLGEPMGGMSAHPGMLYVYVPDTDDAHARALEHGATEVLPPTDYPHGDRYGGVRDVCGNVWWLVTHKG